MTDVGPFMEAAGFDEVTVEDDIVTITNHVGLLTIDVVGSLLDSTIIARQRKKELSVQFDYLEEVTGKGAEIPERYGLLSLFSGPTARGLAVDPVQNDSKPYESHWLGIDNRLKPIGCKRLV